MVVREVHRAPQRRPLREPGGHHDQPDEHEREEERPVAPAPGPAEPGQRERRHQQAGEHDRREEDHHAAAGEQRPQLAAIAHAEIREPVAHQPQRLGQAGRRPDRAGLFREAQEVDAVPRLHEHRHHPPHRRERARERGAPAERQQRLPADAADCSLVQREQHRSQQQPRGHRGIDASAAARDRDRERGRPPPRARHAQAAVDGEQQPRQHGVAEQRHRRARAEHHDVRVEKDEQAGDDVAGPARAPEQRVQEPQGPPHRHRQQRTEPEAVHEPRGEPDRPAEREERPHREQVAAVLAALDVPEVLGRRPRRSHVAEEPRRIEVQPDLRVRRLQARPLRESQGERQGRKPEPDQPVPA